MDVVDVVGNPAVGPANIQALVDVCDEMGISNMSDMLDESMSGYDEVIKNMTYHDHHIRDRYGTVSTLGGPVAESLLWLSRID